jgi:hypothetical protein
MTKGSGTPVQIDQRAEGKKKFGKRKVSSKNYTEILVLTSALARCIPEPVCSETSRQSWDIIVSLSPMKVLELASFRNFTNLRAVSRLKNSESSSLMVSVAVRAPHDLIQSLSIALFHGVSPNRDRI